MSVLRIDSSSLSVISPPGKPLLEDLHGPAGRRLATPAELSDTPHDQKDRSAPEQDHHEDHPSAAGSELPIISYSYR